MIFCLTYTNSIFKQSLPIHLLTHYWKWTTDDIFQSFFVLILRMPCTFSKFCLRCLLIFSIYFQIFLIVSKTSVIFNLNFFDHSSIYISSSLIMYKRVLGSFIQALRFHFSISKSFCNSLLMFLLFNLLKTVLLYLMKSNCCMCSYIPNYSFFIFYFW